MKANITKCAIILMFLLGLAVAERKNWVLLVAGSKNYDNYRHQSDTCHAYQIARANGIPDEQIVVMNYDDIAYSEYNPYPGEIINQPNGPNVYPEVPHDYVGNDVTAEVFLAVLQGDVETVKKLTGQDDPKVIASGPEDHVFVNYDDHGGAGLVAMPTGDFLYASDLNAVLHSMYDQNKFAKLVFYLESCFAGSMFDTLLPDDINVYATTASGPNECSYAWYWDNKRQAYLGDEYSINWMENCDAVDIYTETLEEQYKIVRDLTTKSTVHQYGDLYIASLVVGDFLGSGTRPNYQSGQPEKIKSPYKASNTSALAPDEIGIFVLRQLLKDPRMAHRKEELEAELKEQLWLRAETDAFFTSVAEASLPNEDITWMLNTYSQIKQRSAYEYVVGHVVRLCPRLSISNNDYVAKRLFTLVNLTNKLAVKYVLDAVDLAVQKSPLCSL